jgi:ABC-type nitrate/sulfonate/bicarbonate transport system substrate-binding protein
MLNNDTGRQPTRRKVLGSMGLAAGAALTTPGLRLVGPAYAAAPSIPKTTVRFSMVSYTNHTWPIIAMRKGYFDEVGIKIDPPDARVIFENQTVPLLQNGETDVSTIFVGVLTPVLDKIKNIRPFLIHSYWQGNTILTGPKSSFKTIDDFIAEGKNFMDAAKATMLQLKGQKLTVPPTISTRPWLEFVYAFAGLKIEDSDLVILEDPNAVQLAVSNQVAFAAPAGAVQIYQLQYQANWRPLMSTRQMVKYAGGANGAPVNRILNFDGFAATTDYIEKNQDTIHRFNSVMYRTMAEMFGPDQMAALELQVPFVNSATGASLDAKAIKFIFEELDPFFPWALQSKVWTDKSYPLEYHNVYDYQIQKFIADGTIPKGEYDLDGLFPAKALWAKELAMKTEAEKLAAQADSSNLSGDRKAMAEIGKSWIAKFNFLDAVNYLKPAVT